MPKTVAGGINTHQPGKANNAVQRLVLRISVDSETAGTYRHLTQVPMGHTDPTGSLRPIRYIQDMDPQELGQHLRAGNLPINLPVGGLPLEQLGDNETLHVIIHGDGQGHVEGMGPEDFLLHLMSQGLDPSRHRGTIRLVSCYSGSVLYDGTTFTSQFAAQLRRYGFRSAVIGFEGLVRAVAGGGILVVPTAQAPRFNQLAARKKGLEKLFRKLERQRPPRTAEDSAHTRFLSRVQAFQRMYNEVVEEMKTMWVPQQIGRNIVHIPESEPTADDSQLIKDRDFIDFHRWYSDKLLAMNMIKPGESVRPLRDYSSSYIS